MAKISTTSRTLNYLRTLGWEAGIVERFLHYAGTYGKRVDLFHFLDIVALGDGSIIGVQSCSADFAAHDRKILSEPLALLWMESGGRLMLIGWRKILKKKGGKLRVWSPRIKEYTEDDFSG